MDDRWCGCHSLQEVLFGDVWKQEHMAMSALQTCQCRLVRVHLRDKVVVSIARCIVSCVDITSRHRTGAHKWHRSRVMSEMLGSWLIVRRAP